MSKWMDKMFSDEVIARIVHENARVLQYVLDDPCPAPPWDSAPEEMKTVVLQGVQGARQGRTPREMHDDWVEYKIAHGWRLGAKDAAAKTHPNLIPYEDLPKTERLKDELFLAVVAVILSWM